MKKIKIISLLAVLIVVISSQSCQKGILEGVNDNPNSPTTVTPRVILPGAEGSLAYSQGGDVERFCGIMTQYISGAFRQFFGYQQYVFTEEDFNNLWYNMYAGTMENYKAIMDIEAANPGLYTIYDGIARIQMAYALGMCTDLWGDVPYGDAFQGNENITPGYESQQQIYSDIQALLDQAIDELTNDPGDDFDVPDANDIVYGGDVASWIGLAHALKARNYIHLVNKDPNAAQSALDEVNAGGPIADAGFKFEPGASSDSPWFQYIDQRDDIIYSAQGALEGYGVELPDPGAVAVVIARNDPRYPIYIDTPGDQGHWAPGYMGAFFQAEDATVWFMREFERLFISSEAKLRTGDQAGAESDLQAAINASFTFYGLDPADSASMAYVSTYGVLTGDFNSDLQTIITEKWLANWLSPESYTDMRRTGYPVLTPNSGSAIPTRFIYPTNEHLYNPQPSLPDGGDNINSSLFAPQLWWMP